MENRVTGLFAQAIQKLNEAGDELSRPEEDVVPFLVCRNAQFAIENFLKAYLLNMGEDPGDYKNIKGLYERCLAVNPRFKEIDLSNINCKSSQPDSRSCSDTTKVNHCYETAGNLNKFFRKERIFS